jgi:serine/threonine protein kinase
VFGDVQPSNVILSPNAVVLIDFASARSMSNEKSLTGDLILNPAYAAPEQFSLQGVVGPWTDMFGLGATAYQAITGQAPTPTPERFAGVPLNPTNEFVPNADPSFTDQILRCLALDPTSRPQDIAQSGFLPSTNLSDLLSASVAPETAVGYPKNP